LLVAVYVNWERSLRHFRQSQQRSSGNVNPGNASAL
jgi:hypothetical protein